MTPPTSKTGIGTSTGADSLGKLVDAADEATERLSSGVKRGLVRLGSLFETEHADPPRTSSRPSVPFAKVELAYVTSIMVGVPACSWQFGQAVSSEGNQHARLTV